MFIRKPFVAFAFFTGAVLLISSSLYAVSFPFFEDHSLMLAVVQAFAALLFLTAAVFFAAMFFLLKKYDGPVERVGEVIKRNPATLAKMPRQEDKPSSNAMPLAG